MKVKMILPALTEAESPFWRPVKYSLFPPLGLATLGGYFSEDDEIDLQDQHVEKLNLEDNPDLVIIQVYITNAYRSYKLADYYRKKGSHVVLGGLHVTSLPEEALEHADTIMIGPAGARRGRAAGKYRRRNRATYSGLRRTLLSGACLTRAASNPIQPARRLRAHPTRHARGRAGAGERAAVPLAHE